MKCKSGKSNMSRASFLYQKNRVAFYYPKTQKTNIKGDVFMCKKFNTLISGLRKATQFLSVAAFLSLSGLMSVNVFAAAPPAGGGMAFFTSAIDTLKTLVI